MVEALQQWDGVLRDARSAAVAGWGTTELDTALQWADAMESVAAGLSAASAGGGGAGDGGGGAGGVAPMIRESLAPHVSPYLSTATSDLATARRTLLRAVLGNPHTPPPLHLAVQHAYTTHTTPITTSATPATLNGNGGVPHPGTAALAADRTAVAQAVSSIFACCKRRAKGEGWVQCCCGVCHYFILTLPLPLTLTLTVNLEP
jgi:hypothetical protein